MISLHTKCAYSESERLTAIPVSKQNSHSLLLTQAFTQTLKHANRVQQTMDRSGAPHSPRRHQLRATTWHSLTLSRARAGTCSRRSEWLSSRPSHPTSSATGAGTRHDDSARRSYRGIPVTCPPSRATRWIQTDTSPVTEEGKWWCHWRHCSRRASFRSGIVLEGGRALSAYLPHPAVSWETQAALTAFGPESAIDLRRVTNMTECNKHSRCRWRFMCETPASASFSGVRSTRDWRAIRAHI